MVMAYNERKEKQEVRVMGEQWKRLNKYCGTTDTHAVCQVKTGLISWHFVSYRRLKSGGFKVFGTDDTKDEAKTRCENDAKFAKKKGRK